MSMQDFWKETKKRAGVDRGLTSGEKEIQAISFKLYNGTKDGETRAWVREAGELLIKNIAPNLSPANTAEAVSSIEGIILIVLMDVLLSGTVLKMSKHNKEKEGGI